MQYVHTFSLPENLISGSHISSSWLNKSSHGFQLMYCDCIYLVGSIHQTPLELCSRKRSPWLAGHSSLFFLKGQLYNPDSNCNDITEPLRQVGVICLSNNDLFFTNKVKFSLVSHELVTVAPKCALCISGLLAYVAKPLPRSCQVLSVFYFIGSILLKHEYLAFQHPISYFMAFL